MGGKIGSRALWGFTPFVACTHHLTHASYSAGDVEKNGFCLGESAPIWGRYGGLKFGFFANFGLLLLETLSTDFPFFDGVRQPRGCTAENFAKINFVEFEQFGSKIGGWGTFGFWAIAPKLTIASYSSGDPENNGFCLEGIGPHLGEIWGFEIWHFLAFWRTLAYFCSKLCRQIFDFLTAF